MILMVINYLIAFLENYRANCRYRLVCISLNKGVKLRCTSQEKKVQNRVILRLASHLKRRILLTRTYRGIFFYWLRLVIFER